MLRSYEPRRGDTVRLSFARALPVGPQRAFGEKLLRRVVVGTVRRLSDAGITLAPVTNLSPDAASEHEGFENEPATVAVLWKSLRKVTVVEYASRAKTEVA